MLIVVNSDPHELTEQATLAELVDSLGLTDAPCATEVNRELVPKRSRAACVLREGDVVEVVSLVGGG